MTTKRARVNSLLADIIPVYVKTSKQSPKTLLEESSVKITE